MLGALQKSMDESESHYLSISIIYIIPAFYSHYSWPELDSEGPLLVHILRLGCLSGWLLFYVIY